MIDRDASARAGESVGEGLGPTAARILGELVAAPRPQATEAIAERLGLHPNGVRQHLTRLQRRGLVERLRERRPRGRPRDLWRAAAAAPRALPGSAEEYRALALWLAQALESNPQTLEPVGRAIGRRLAEHDLRAQPAAVADEPAEGRGGDPGGDAGDGCPAGAEPPEFARLARLVSSLGFAPTVELQGRGLRMRLCRCPYAEVAAASPRVVCGLHRAITEGVVERLLPGGRVERFEARDPREAGCVVEASVG